MSSSKDVPLRRVQCRSALVISSSPLFSYAAEGMRLCNQRDGVCDVQRDGFYPVAAIFLTCGFIAIFYLAKHFVPLQYRSEVEWKLPQDDGVESRDFELAMLSSPIPKAIKRV